MSVTLADLIARKVTALTASDLAGLERIKTAGLRECRSLKSVSLPSTVKEIATDAFFHCDALASLEVGVDPECVIEDVGDSSELTSETGGSCFRHTAWWTAQGAVMLTSDDGRILLGNKVTDPTGGYTIPAGVTNLAAKSLAAYSTSYTLTEAVIPDHVEMVQESVFSGHTLSKLTVGSGVRRMLKGLTSGSQAMTLIFRQPAGMAVELPTPGDGTGLCYNKDSRAYTIYTDNEAIRAYGWSTDNVTATFYSLAEAP